MYFNFAEVLSRLPGPVLYVEDDVKSSADGMAFAFPISRYIPGRSERRVLYVKTETVAESPPQVEKSPDLGFQAKQNFAPLSARADAVEAERRLRAPYGVGNGWSVQVVGERGEGISQASEDAVARRGVVGEIIVAADAEIRCVRFIMQPGCLVGVVAYAPSHLKCREKAVLKVCPRRSLILSVGRYGGHDGATQIARYGKACEEGLFLFVHGFGRFLARFVLDAAYARLLAHGVLRQRLGRELEAAVSEQ